MSQDENGNPVPNQPEQPTNPNEGQPSAPAQ